MKLEGGERLVLKILRDLQGDSTDYVEDSRIAVAAKMLVGDVRDWLDTLEGKGFVERARLTEGFSALITAKGKQALRLSEPITSPKPVVADAPPTRTTPEGVPVNSPQRTTTVPIDRPSAPGNKSEDVLLIDGIRTQDWPSGESSNEYWHEVGSIVNDTYLWEATALKGGITAQLSSSLPAASDFELQANIRLLHGSNIQYGLFFRKTYEAGYYFLLDNTGNKGRFGLNQWLKSGEIKNILPWTASPVIDSQGGNNVKIVSRGPDIQLFINSSPVGLIQNATATSGQIGLAATLNAGQSATIEISSFKLRIGGFSASSSPGPTSTTSGSGAMEGFQVVLLIHGIRDQGEWQSMLKNKLAVPGKIDVIPIKYGYFDALRFWSPFGTRAKPIERVYIQIRVALQKYGKSHPKAQLSIIAHSFGTYIVGEILRRGFDLKLDRLILCGSVLPQDFPWEQYQGRFNDESLINEVGKADIWPVMAQSLSWGYGASGTHGFGAVLVKDRFHAGGHGQYFEPEFVDKYWEPFIRRGEYKATDFEVKMPPTPWWVSVIGILPLKWAIVGLLFIGFALAALFVASLNVPPSRSRSNTGSSTNAHEQPLRQVSPGDIDIASSSFMDYEGDALAPRLDLKLTNMGIRPAFVTKVNVNVKQIWRLRDLPQVPGKTVPPGHNYIVKLKPRQAPYRETVELSEGLKNDEFGRFSLQFEENPWSASNTIYLANVEVITNSDEATYKTKDLLFLVTMQGSLFPDKQSLEELIADAKSSGEQVDMAAVNKALTENKRIILEVDKIQAGKNPALLQLIESAKKSPLGQP